MGGWNPPFDRELINEMNVERYELKKTGQSEFSRPDGTHDARFCALALAVYASQCMLQDPRYENTT